MWASSERTNQTPLPDLTDDVTELDAELTLTLFQVLKLLLLRGQPLLLITMATAPAAQYYSSTTDTDTTALLQYYSSIVALT